MDIDYLHRQLHACGFTKARIRLSEDPQIEDDIIEIDDRVHIQLGYYGDVRVVVEKVKDGRTVYAYRPDRLELRELVDDLREVMDNK